MTQNPSGLTEMEKQKLLYYRYSLGIKGRDPYGLNQLGVILMGQGKIADAAIAFRRAVQLHPKYAAAYQNLGNTYTVLDEPDKALDSFKEALRLDPKNQTALHLTKALSGENPATLPICFIRSLFDQYAKSFDGHLTNALQYKGPALMRKALKDCRLDQQIYANAIDLGCGTGLAGLAFAGLITRLSGIDLSANMLRKAEKKNIYHKLEQGDICSVLRESREFFDLFIASDVLIYFGDLDCLFEVVHQKSRPKATMIFTTESHRTDTYKLQRSGRYAHSRAYISELARKHRFKKRYCRKGVIRKEKGICISGDIYVLQKKRDKSQFAPCC